MASSSPSSGTAAVKLIVVGEINVGKTALLCRFVDRSFAPQNLKATVGVDFKTKKLVLPGSTEEVTLHIADTAGSERFSALSPSYYRGAEGAIVVYDVTNRKSFDEIDHWLEQLVKNTGRADLDGFSVFVAANKCDLVAPRRVVSKAEAAAWCQSRGLSHVECSALDGSGVEPLFVACAASAVDYRAHMNEDVRKVLEQNSVLIGKAERGREKKSGGCC